MDKQKILNRLAEHEKAYQKKIDKVCDNYPKGYFQGIIDMCQTLTHEVENSEYLNN